MRGGKQFEMPENKDLLLTPVDRRGPGKNRALLMIHGFSSTPAVYRHFIDKIIGYDAILVPALPGHAASIAEFGKTSAAEWLDYIHAICDELTQEFQAVDVLGLSLGGLLASWLGSHFKLNHLYLLAPAFDLPRSLRRTILLARFLKLMGFTHFGNAAGNLYTSLNCEIAYHQMPLSTLIELLEFIRQFQFKLPDCPTDLFLGCHDKVVQSLKIASRFDNNANTRIHWLKNSAHVLPLDGDAEYIVNCINNNLVFPAKTL